jgi:hypothetical protein
MFRFDCLFWLVQQLFDGIVDDALDSEFQEKMSITDDWLSEFDFVAFCSSAKKTAKSGAKVDAKSSTSKSQLALAGENCFVS